MQIEGLDYLQKPQIQSRIAQIKDAKDQDLQLAMIRALFREIQNSSSSVVDGLQDGIPITNLDEITTSYHNETQKNTKLLLRALKELQLSQEKQAQIISEVTKDATNAMGDEFQTIRIKKSRDRVFVTNAGDFPRVEEVSIRNLQELESYFTSLANSIKNSLKIEIPAPQVTINPPEVNVSVPETIIPDMDLDGVIEAVETSLRKIKTNNLSNPLMVRLTDLDKLLKKLDEVSEASRTAVLGFPGIIGIRDVSGGLADPGSFGGAVSPIASTLGDGNKSVTTAGTRVQLITTSTPCKWVVVIGKVSNSGTMYAGGGTIASGRGVPLVQLQSQRFDINNVNQVWIDADTNGDGVTFCYGS